MIKIYMLVNVATGQPFYVGASKHFPHTVLNRHHMKLKNKEKGIGYVQIDSANTVLDAANLEEYWFWQLRSWGFELENSFTRTYRRYKPSQIYLYDAA